MQAIQSINSMRLQARTRAAASRPTKRSRGAVVARAAQASDDTLSKVRSIISQQLNADMEKVSPDAKFVDLGADSLDTVEIMMALEEQFDITLDEEGAENIATVQEAADMIEQFLQAKA